ncbi:DUF1989 domain-containing protein [Blastococcus saxobsidens]|uniref:DUF1989 domain-containing protein n=1 Tax=Blastococcus saxobsidens TaxID=138336 RepID=A0A4Q7Y3K1_9ACTN|nr:urea carboxylase-associated family protein [Blastococcus saxobsidens]RZU30974.1 hypothetical protein BKA19_0611 [Blastococcus saxobsidens]
MSSATENHREIVVPRNTGWSTSVPAGRSIRVRGWTIVDFVVFDAHDLRHRFDQARTKTNQNTLFVTAGHVLYSKSNQVMMTITEDTFEGTHDMQKGMCSRQVHELAFRKGLMKESFLRDISWEELPDHGCWENLSRTLQPHGIAPEDIPSPLNIFQHMSIDAVSGHMTNSRLRPPDGDGAYVTFRAEMDCLVALSACPDLSIGGRDVMVSVF